MCGQDRRDKSDLGLWGVTWSVDQPGMSAVVPDRRDNSDLGLWGVTWSVDQPGMSPVVLDRRDNLDSSIEDSRTPLKLRGNPTIG